MSNSKAFSGVLSGFSVINNKLMGESTDISRLFEEQAMQTPDLDAVTINGVTLTYHELNERANQLSYYLRKKTNGSPSIIAICAHRSIEMIVGILGIIKAGSAYLPLDINHPKDRLLFMLKEADVSILLTQENIDYPFLESVEPIFLDASWSEISNEGKHNSGLDRPINDIAYVMYTSGTTGKPKGVEVKHTGILNLLEDLDKHHHLPTGIRYSVWTSFSFDVSALEIFSSLLSGGTLCIVPDDVRLDVNQYFLWLQQNRVEASFIPPFMLNDLAQWLKENQIKTWSMKRLITGLEPIRTSTLAQIAKQMPELQIINGYGPTETSICATLHFFSEDESDPYVPIGKPVQHSELYILDTDKKPVQTGELGELYIGGIGVAKGYLKQPELTSESFIYLSFGQEQPKRLYRTGDMVRSTLDGTLSFGGRVDDQIKLRGYRIELGEIEKNLIEHPALDEVAVILREDEPSFKRLVGYVVTKASLDWSELKHWLANRLPSYMLPEVFVEMEALPKSISGKINRKTLPVPTQENSSLNVGNFREAETSEEKWIADLWSHLLRVEKVGMTDDFFMSGGNSLLATQMLGKVQARFKAHIPMTTFFREATIEALVAFLNEFNQPAENNNFRIQPVSRDNRLPTTFAQERVWFIEQLEPQNLAYNYQTLFHFKGKLNVAALQKSLDEIISRHEIFRTTFTNEHGQLTQKIHPPTPAKIKQVDFRELSDPERIERLEQHIQMELEKVFDMTRLPLVRWVLLRVMEDEYYLLHIEHHMVHDGWSFAVFLRELTALYKAFAEGRPSPLSPIDIQFADFTHWQRQWLSQVEHVQLDFWQKKLEGSSGLLELPFDRPRPPKQTFKGGLFRIELPLSLSKKIRGFGQRTGYTMFMTMLAGFSTLLYRYSGQDDLLIGTGIANRRSEDTEHLIGMIVNTILLRTQLTETMSFRDLLKHVKEVALEAYEYQDLPFDRLVETLEFERDMSRNPLCQVAFSFHDTPYPELDWPDVEIGITEPLSNGSAKFDMNIVVIPRYNADLSRDRQMNKEGITLIWEYNSALFDSTTIERMIAQYQHLLEQAMQDVELPLWQVPILPKHERDLLLTEWNQTANPLEAPSSSLDQLFEQQVERYPDTVAVSFKGDSLTYVELNERANQLAHYLCKQGVADKYVGAYFNKSIEMIVAMLGIIKAGGAYVPLDPNYPQERLRYMIEDTQLSVILTHQPVKDQLPAGLEVICLNTQKDKLQSERKDNVCYKNDPNRLAYAIYTSGTTGKPKGAMLGHLGVINLIEAIEEKQPISSGDRCSYWAGCSFDVSLYEMFSALLNGGSLCITPENIRLDNERFIDWLEEQHITHAYFPAYMLPDLKLILEQGTKKLPMKRMIVGVEPISEALLIEIKKLLPNLCLLNAYGPTETTIISTFYELKAKDSVEGGYTPIGKPIQNTHIYLLDQYLQAVPIGVPGEVYIGGLGLAQGYINQPELTKEKFISSPFMNEKSLLYKTGDIARYLPDGNILFLGRDDEQVKINGVRIELGEIETQIKTYPSVKDALVLVHEENHQKRIIAYMTLLHGEATTSADIYNHLRKVLPHTMMPATCVFLDKWPVTRNGKLDKKALPHPETEVIGNEYIAPRNSIETKVAEEWSELLGQEKINIHSSFFELGGYSIIATRLVFKLSETFNLKLTLRDFFDQPTIAGVAQRIDFLLQDKKNRLDENRIIPRSQRRLNH
ncbi:non-ribosomal peptide synthetase [Bacillus horti]|uniref:Amino acid adenylation domain-containing protein n=1 Tax=Caldalkalibacillus horti TaxID=77523 RepID=A0ABT9VTM8_9BACI|nr:non-ribosomal peptide synthetase [Bacillus horti]MDQ0164207.1 amino acid adenylation domain-containing protein [Bacillus horti]